MQNYLATILVKGTNDTIETHQREFWAHGYAEAFSMLGEAIESTGYILVSAFIEPTKSGGLLGLPIIKP